MNKIKIIHVILFRKIKNNRNDDIFTQGVLANIYTYENCIVRLQ